MADFIPHVFWPIWMVSDSLWASQCIKHLPVLCQLGAMWFSRWICLCLSRWYPYFFIRFSERSSEESFNSPSAPCRCRVTTGCWQVWIWSAINKVFELYCESRHESLNEFCKDWDHSELTSTHHSLWCTLIFEICKFLLEIYSQLCWCDSIIDSTHSEENEVCLVQDCGWSI